MSGPVEPSADLRKLAKELRGMYVALISEGFTVPEAMGIIAAIISRPSS